MSKEWILQKAPTSCPVQLAITAARHGIAGQVPGLYFAGLPFQTGLTSTLVGGARSDAALVARHIAQGRNTAAPDYTAEHQNAKPLSGYTARRRSMG
jgi:hypothetical protein